MSGATAGLAWVRLGAAAIVAAAIGSAALAQPKDAIDQMADEIIKRALRDAVSPANPDPKPQAAQPAAPSDRPLQAIAKSEAPIPLPDGAEFIDFRGPDGKLEFTSTASVAALAAFHRSTLKPLGWRDQPSVINRANMVVLDFVKDDKSISFTIMQMGKTVNVSAHGSGLVVRTAKIAKTAAAAKTPGAIPAAAAVPDLEADEKSGLPFPKTNTLNGTDKTPFRVLLTVKTSADFQSVLAFYRRELGKRNWTQVSERTVSDPPQATIGFTSPEGPAVLKLAREGDATTVALSLRKTAAATKAGVLPKAGQSKMLFGNMLDKEAVITVAGKTVKVGAGIGTKAPDGPTVDLPPGKHTVSFKVAGGAAQTENVTVGADETWGLLIGPGGALALQVY